jgi:hypothetical protein
VHVRSGSGSTSGTPNGTGNLIIGYNEDSILPTGKNRSGSHNLVVGSEHTFSSYGGLIAGYWNTVSAEHGSVSGGFANTVSALRGSVLGGFGNSVRSDTNVVVGGAGVDNDSPVTGTAMGNRFTLESLTLTGPPSP